MLLNDTFRKSAEAIGEQLYLGLCNHMWWIGERDKVAFGSVMLCSEQGTSGRLKIELDNGQSIVWRTNTKVIAILRNQMPILFQSAYELGLN